MNPIVTIDGLRKILGLTAVFILSLVAAYPFSPAGRQARHLAAAKKHSATLAPMIDQDPRFADVNVGYFTGGGGMLWVFGSVSSNDDLVALQKLVAGSGPPVETKWNIAIIHLPSGEMGSSNRTNGR